jgi:hypothetical protein
MEFHIHEISHTSQQNVKSPQWGVSHPLKDTGLVLQREYSVFEISSVSISR